MGGAIQFRRGGTTACPPRVLTITCATGTAAPKGRTTFWIGEGGGGAWVHGVGCLTGVVVWMATTTGALNGIRR